MADHFTPEFRAWLDKKHAEEAEQFGAMLDAMLLEAQSLRLAEGHKARGRTLPSEDRPERLNVRRKQQNERI